MDLHPIRPVKFDWALITGHIGWKFIGITLPGQIGYLSEFDQHLSQWIYTQIRLDMKYWSKWA